MSTETIKTASDLTLAISTALLVLITIRLIRHSERMATASTATAEAAEKAAIATAEMARAELGQLKLAVDLSSPAFKLVDEGANGFALEVSKMAVCITAIELVSATGEEIVDDDLVQRLPVDLDPLGDSIFVTKRRDLKEVVVRWAAYEGGTTRTARVVPHTPDQFKSE